MGEKLEQEKKPSDIAAEYLNWFKEAENNGGIKLGNQKLQLLTVADKLNGIGFEFSKVEMPSGEIITRHNEVGGETLTMNRLIGFANSIDD